MLWNTFFLDYRMLILRGAVSLAFGVLALLWPAPALLTISLLYGAYAFVDGAAAVASGVRRGRARESWALPVLEGVFGLAVGVITFVWPGITLFALSILVGAWAIATGFIELFAAIYRPPQPVVADFSRGSRILLGVAGFFSVLLGVIVFSSPVFGALALLFLVAVYAVAFGAALLALGFRLRKERRRLLGDELGRAA